MPATYAAAVSLVLASVLAGQALGCLIGRGGWWAPGPAVGMALLICVCALGVRLPGDSVAAAALAGLVLLAAAVLIVRARVGVPPLLWVGTVIAALAITALPFYVNERVGLLGISLNNDTAVHLLWAEGLRSKTMAAMYTLPPGYPLGPHALMGALASATGLAMDEVMNGLLVTVPALTALAALSLLWSLVPTARAAGALLVAFCYLATAWFAQGSFKETLLALFLVALTAVLLEARAREPARAWRATGVPIGLLAAGGVQVYSYLALAWFGAIVTAWVVLELALGGRTSLGARLRASVRALVAPVAAATAVLVVGVAGQLDRILSYLRQVSLSPAGGQGGIPAGDLGNLAGRLSPYEVLGAWPSPDFRFPPQNAFHAGELGAVALAAVLVGAVVVLRRREGALAAGALAACAIFLLADRGQSPYVAAKALMLASPLVMALALRSFPDLSAAGGRWRQGNLARLALVGVFGAGAAYSSSLALRAAPVASRAQQAELEGLRPLLGNRPTLFLGIDDHVGWWLRGVRLGTPQLAAFPSPITVSVRPEKPYGYGQPLDFDSFDHATLDGFSYVVAPRSPYDSDPPENFRRVRAGRLFEVWERRGPTAERETLEAPGAPGAVRDCRRPAQRRLQGAGGVAWVRAAPRVSNASAAAGIPPGSAAEMSLSLSPGRWRLGLQYVSTTPMRVLSGRSEWRLPPNTGRPGPFFELGTVDARGGAPTRFRVIAERTARLRSRGAGANVSALSATPEAAGRRISLDRSCHRYVDWYRLGTARR